MLRMKSRRILIFLSIIVALYLVQHIVRQLGGYTFNTNSAEREDEAKLPDCVNELGDAQCTEFFRKGLCEKTPNKMWFKCYKACSRCDCENQHAKDSECRIWEKAGECDSNKVFMWSNCYRSCSLCEGVRVTHKVRFDMSQGGKPIGAFTIGVFGDVAPITVANFVALANHTYGFGFKGTIFHRVINKFVVQGGDITMGNGVGGRSIYGGMFKDEAFILKHIGRGWVNMANSGQNTNKSQFSILTVLAEWLNGHHVVFGKILDGYDVMHHMETSATSDKDRPIQDQTIDKIDVSRVAHRLEVEKKDVIGDGDGCKNVNSNETRCVEGARRGDCFTGDRTEWMWEQCYRSCSRCDRTFTAPYQRHVGSGLDLANTHEKRSASFCDNQRLELHCPAGHGILIQSAFYGRTNAKTCPDLVTADTPTNCVSSGDIEAKLKETCSLYEKCSETVGPRYIGFDPCPGVPKYLNINYDCADFELMKNNLRQAKDKT